MAKTIIFDMDGTLVDSLMFWDVLWKYFGERFGRGSSFRPDAQVERAVRTVPLKEAMDIVHTGCRIGESGDELFHAANELIEQFYSCEVQLKPGVLKVLQEFKEAGIPMCLASATEHDMIRIALAHCGITDYFSEIFSCASSGRGKEHPDVYLEALGYLGTDAESTWVFEDSYVALKTAREIGLPTVGIYDIYNANQDAVKECSVLYIGEGESLEKILSV